MVFIFGWLDKACYGENRWVQILLHSFWFPSFRVTNSMVKLLFSHFRVMNVKLINESNSLNVTVSMSVNP